MDKELTLEIAMKQLDEIISKMQSDETDLENSLKLYEEGAKLIAFCKERIVNAELKIKMISDEADDENEV